MANIPIRGLAIADLSVPSRGYGGLPIPPTMLTHRGTILGGDVFNMLNTSVSIDFVKDSFPGGSLSPLWTSSITGVGTGWTSQHSFGGGRLYDVWGFSANDVWVTNTGSNAYHWNGSTWTAKSVGSSDIYTCIWGFASNDVWMAGDLGLIIHWNGTVWGTPVTPTGWPGSEPIFGIWGASPSDIWVVGQSGDVAHYNGSTWTTTDALGGTYNFDMYGFSASDIWISGDSGKMHHWNGTAWSSAVIGNLGTEVFNSVFGVASNDVWAIGEATVGGAGVAYHWNGSTWTQVTVPGSPDELRGAWGAATNDVWFGSDNGTIYHWNGTAIIAYSPTFPSTTQWGMWGFGPNDVWLTSGDTTSATYHFNGTGAGGSVVVNDGLFLNVGTTGGSSSTLSNEIYKNFDVSVLFQYDNAVEQFFPTNEITYLRVRAQIDASNYFTLAYIWDPAKGPEIRVSVTTSGVTTIVTTDTGHASARALRLIRYDGRMQAYAGSVLLADFHGWRTDDVRIELASESILTPVPISTKVLLFDPHLMVTFGDEIAPFVNLIANRIVGSTPAHKLPGLVEVKIHNINYTISLGEVFTYFAPLQLTVSGLEGTAIVVNNDEQLRDSTPTLPGLRLYD